MRQRMSQGKKQGHDGVGGIQQLTVVVLLQHRQLYQIKIILNIQQQRMNLVQQKAKQRNITPNFLRFRRKSTANSIGKKTGQQDKVETQITTQRTERSSSKASRCSFEAYERRVLHLSKLKNQIHHKETNQDQHENPPVRKNQLIVGQNFGKTRQSSPSDRPFHTERDYDKTGTILSVKKKNTASGKIITKLGGRTPSNQKRSQESLQKQDQRAKQINTQLMNNLMKNQFAPNYINKLKMKKMQNATEKKRSTRNKLLNLIVTVKPQQQMNHYQIYGQLGKGAYGVVRMGLDKRTNQKIAIKIYEKKRLDEPNKIKNLQREINILAQLSNNTIAKLIDVIETQSELYLVLQYGGANSLYNYLLSKPQHRLPETEAKQFLLVISEVLLYLHDLQIVHRDIKAENILINRHRQLKLIDFGFSLRCKKHQTIDTFCGTPTYMAPQIVSKVDHCPIYTDMWSLGILFYVMLQGNYPFRAKSETQLFEKIKKGSFEYIHNNISKESKRLIENLLKVNPLQRLTIHQVLTKQNRKWLSQQE